MEEIKKISVNAFEKAMNDNYVPYSEIEWNGITITVKRNLSFGEMMEFVESVAQLCFATDTDRYIPEVKDFAIKTLVLEKYTNIRMPQNIEKRYEFVSFTNVTQTVLSNVDKIQFNEIVNAIDTKLEYMSNANIEAVNRQVTALSDTLQNLESQFADLFSGLDSSSITQLVNAITDNQLDEEKLMKAYFDERKSVKEENGN